MSTLVTKSFSQIVGAVAAGMQGRITSRFLNFAIGSVLRGFAEAYAGVLLWIQKDALDIQKQTRLATSFGADVDSFVADFPLSGVARLGAQPATVLCTFGRYTAGPAPVYVPVGGIVKTSDGTQSFQVYADTTNPAFDESYTAPGASSPAGGYLMAPQVENVAAPVQSITPGTAGAPGANGNVGAGAIALIASSMPGVDTVTNVAAATNGIDAEADGSVKTRFALAVRGRGGGTVPAIQSAVANLRVGMQATVLEGQDINGNVAPGVCSVIIDDGSGNVSSAILSAAQTAVDRVRPAGMRVGVYAATERMATVVMTITTRPGYDHNTVVAKVSAALALFINGLGQGVTLAYFDLPAIAKGVPGVLEVQPGNYLLNGGTTDMVGTPQSTIKAGSLVIS